MVDSAYFVKSAPLAFTGSFQHFENMFQTYWRCAWRSSMQKKYFFDKQYAGGLLSKSYLLPSFIFLVWVISLSGVMPLWKKIRMKYDACHILRTVHAWVLKCHIWIPHGKIADLYFFLVELFPCLELCPFEKSEWNLVSKISRKEFELGAWNLVSR